MVIDYTDDNAPEKQNLDNDPNKEPEEKAFPEDITEKALERLRSVVIGNGVKAEALTVDEIQGAIFDFEAKSHFKIETLVTDKRTTGREQGMVCGSMADVKLRIANEIEKLGSNKDIKKTTIEYLKTRKDLGFAVENQVIKLDKHRHRYVIHESCNICRGDGKIECKHCQGKGREICNRCHGDKFMPCTICRGSGTTQNQQNQQQQCTQCRGEGRIPCRYCHQSGQQQCKMCKSSGQLACHECNHSGWRSHITTVQFKALNRFDYDKEPLPPETLPIIEDLGPELITDGHATAEIIQDIARNDALDTLSEKNHYTVGYDTHLPWGDMTAKIKNMPITAKVFGFNGEVLFVTPFMEKVTAKPLALLDEAAMNPSLIEGHLKVAGKYRVTREIIFAASRYSLAKGRQFLEGKYPFGYQDGTLSDILVKTDKILKNITRGPRKNGFIAGMIATTLLFSAYIFSGAGQITENLSPLKSSGIAPDIAVIGVGIIAAIYTTKIMARNALHDIIGKLLPDKAQKSLMPKIGILGIYAALLCLALFLGLQEIARQAGFAPSLWYDALRGVK